MLKPKLVHARRDVDAVAGVVTDLFRRNAAKSVVGGLNPRCNEAAAILDAGVGGAAVVGGEPWVVDLQCETGIDDGAILHVERSASAV